MSSVSQNNALLIKQNKKKTHEKICQTVSMYIFHYNSAAISTDLVCRFSIARILDSLACHAMIYRNVMLKTQYPENYMQTIWP